MDFLESFANDEVFTYIDVQNLSINHPLITSEIEQYKDLIFSPNSLEQIYFKGTCDIDTIFFIKNLLSISEYTNEEKIDKFILLKLNQAQIDKLLNETYEYPSTWKLPYEMDDESYSLTDIPSFRTIRAFLQKLIDRPLSSLEQIMRIYDEIKLFDYLESDERSNVPEIVQKRKANSYGMNKLFAYILKELGFSCFTGVLSNNKTKSYVTLVLVRDAKYKIDGIYVFDPSSDNLARENYEKDEVRRINYNYFGINLDMLTRSTSKDKLEGILQILSLNDLNYSTEKIEICKSYDTLKEKDRLLKSFKLDYETIYEKIKNTKPLDIETIVKINDVLYPSKKEKYNDILKENYRLRKDDLFYKDTIEELEEFVSHEK